MDEDPKVTMNFRLGRDMKRSLAALAQKDRKPVGQLVREAVEGYVVDRKRAAWEEEAQRSALEIRRASEVAGSDEAESLRGLDGALAEYAKEWVWDEDGEGTR